MFPSIPRGGGRLLLPILCVLACTVTSRAQTDADKAMSALMRLGYGPSPTTLAIASASPAALLAYINQQLNPPTPLVDNTEVQALYAAFNDPLNNPGYELPTVQGAPGNDVSLMTLEVGRALLTDHQLLERMGQFWENHFNTYSFKVRQYFTQQGVGIPMDQSLATWFEKSDNDYYRERSLGTYRDLLTRTAESVAMLIYLDNHVSTANELNENWGRELLELFTQGQIWASAPGGVPNQNYTQDDVILAARCFTGYTITQTAGQFHFTIDDTVHDSTPKVLFAVTGRPLRIPAGGAQFQVTRLIDYLVRSPRTKDFIIRKLMTVFLGDTAPEDHPNLLSQAAAAWGPDGDIRAVMTVLLTSSQFLDAGDAWNIVSDPMHFAVSMQRRTGAVVDVANGSTAPYLQRLLGTLIGMGLMGRQLHGYPSPDGYPIASDEQVGSNIYFEHVQFAQQFINNSTVSLLLRPDGLALAGLSGTQLTDPVTVADHLLHQYFADKQLGPQDPSLVEQTLQGLPDPGLDPIGYALQMQFAGERIFLMTHGAVK